MECKQKKPSKETILALGDAIELLRGKWKISILRNLSFGEMRFKDLLVAVAGISPKVLSKELQDLEQNLLITRTVNNTKPITVSYAITDHADSTVPPIINALLEFGLNHRKKIMAHSQVEQL
ncbi:helix-turn-helix transcriptional regulator [Sphingobacterium phlebotomi]|uniref:Helix-turn-helix transcriptional regulator n=2 Tax=Sphingobacterium phlebotomi TaxID=2605433 RepID=A0A5D4GV60_9SPHI|nr:helix-turn-helix transcriptional regulator [Sphingobacterium phlebotomi]